MSFVGSRQDQIRTTIVVPNRSRLSGEPIHIKSEDSSVGLSRRIETQMRSSPDSSTADDFPGMSGGPNVVIKSNCPYRCPQCPALCSDESVLSDHLFHVHRVRLIKTETQSPVTTRCPVCRHQVTDLSHHFAMEHSERKGAHNNNNNNNNHSSMNNNNHYSDEKPIITNGAVTSSSNGATNGYHHDASDSTKVIPIFLPNHPVPEAQLRGRKVSEADDRVSPMNLSVRRSVDHELIPNGMLHSDPNYDPPTPATLNNNVLPYNARSAEDSEDVASNFSGEYQTSSARSVADARKRRKQTHVPDASKDDKYWARRMKNNEAAKRSRDMRIKREKIVFEENAKLEQDNRDMRAELDRVITENKELHLKLGLILDENARLKNLLYSMQNNSEERIDEHHL